MFLIRGQKLKKYLSAFIICVAFLFLLVSKNAEATSTIVTYQKPYNGTLTAAEWNGLFTDFVNTWMTASMVGPLGIGVTDPLATLHVNGLGTTTAIFSNGSVGIGTTTPAKLLHVAGQAQFDSFAYAITPSSLDPLALATVEYVNSYVAGAAGPWTRSGSYIFPTTLSDKIGIGITNPINKLDVRAGFAWNASGTYARLANDTTDNRGLLFGQIFTGTDSLSYIQAYKDAVAAYYPLLLNPLGGNVGIGTTNPTLGTLQIQSPIADNTNLYLRGLGTGAGNNTKLTFGNTNNAFIAVDGVANFLKMANVGSLDLYSGGTNQNITLTPSGTGYTILNGNVGIGTTTPAKLLHVAGQGKFDSYAYGITPSSLDTLALTTVEYVNGYVNTATSTMSTSGKYVGATPGTYTGNQGSYSASNLICNNTVASSSHVCMTSEIINTINSGLPGSIPQSSDLWINNGPPGFTVNANDCIGWTSSAGTDRGTKWFKATTGEGNGSLEFCNQPLKFSCCK